MGTCCYLELYRTMISKVCDSGGIWEAFSTYTGVPWAGWGQNGLHARRLELASGFAYANKRAVIGHSTTAHGCCIGASTEDAPWNAGETRFRDNRSCGLRQFEGLRVVWLGYMSPSSLSDCCGDPCIERLHDVDAWNGAKCCSCEYEPKVLIWSTTLS